MNTYETVVNSKSQIKKAGERISKYSKGSPEYDKCIEIIDNWRAAHAYPLAVIANEINNALYKKENILIVQRLKRRESIIGKLLRPRNTSLDRMQDLAGCRVIVPDVEDVYVTADMIREQLEKTGHRIVREDDYLVKPPGRSGYRSYHMIVSFQSNDSYNGLFAEIQIRTKVQNAWATAVEIIDCVENETLKAGTGKESYRYFFKLVSGLFSHDEKTSIVEGIPQEQKEIIDEIYRLDNIENIREKLAAYSNAIKVSSEYPSDAGYYLLLTDTREKTIRVIPYKQNQLHEATQSYQDEEKRKTNGMDVVLVAAQSFETIRESYSNYFLEAQFFLNKIAQLCQEHPEKASIMLDTSKNGFRITSRFEATPHRANIPRSLQIREDGIGDIQGNSYYCLAFPITLTNSYLRYSGIIRSLDELTKNGEIKPHKVEGPAIVAISTGACYYVNNTNWQYISAFDSIVIQPKNKKDNFQLLYLLGWLKSNISTWDLLWNKHRNNYYEKSIFTNLYVPDMEQSNMLSICEMVNEIITREHQFVYDFQTPDQGGNYKNSQEDVDAFNNGILPILGKIENLFLDFYHVSIDERIKINDELRLKGYYVYT